MSKVEQRAKEILREEGYSGLLARKESRRKLVEKMDMDPGSERPNELIVECDFTIGKAEYHRAEIRKTGDRYHGTLIGDFILGFVVLSNGTIHTTYPLMGYTKLTTKVISVIRRLQELVDRRVE